MRQKYDMTLDDYEPSAYNVVVVNANGETIVANTLTRSVVKIDGQTLSEDDITSLASEGIIVSHDSFEKASLLTAINYAKFNTDSARIVVCPTMACNFRCPYCFQEHRNMRDMTPEIQEAILEHIKVLVEQSHVREIVLSWFGGEPLLRDDIVTSLTKEVRAYCYSQGAGFRASMTTNGFLLTPEIVFSLQQIEPNWTIQVTIDGPKDIHDSRRSLTNGDGSFDRIVKNIKSIDSKAIELHVRVNIDKTNFWTFKQVAELFEDRENVFCYAAPVTIEETQSEDQVKSCYSHSEHCDMWLNLFKAGAVQEDLDSLLSDNLAMCSAEDLYSVVIDSEGFLYKCIDQAGSKDHAFGHIINEKIDRPGWKSRYIGRDVLNEPECCDCAFVPLCQGGCYTQFENHGTHSCSRAKALLPKILERL